MKQFVAITEDGKYLQWYKNTGHGPKDVLRKVDALNEATLFTGKDLRPIGNPFRNSDLICLKNCNHLEATVTRIVTLVKEEKS